MKIKKDRLIIEGTPNLIIYKRAQDCILLDDNKCFLLLKNSSFEYFAKGNTIFKYSTSFTFENIELNDALIYLNDETNKGILKNSIEINFLNSITKSNKVENLLLDFSEKEKRFNSLFLNFQLKENLKEKSSKRLLKKI